MDIKEKKTKKGTKIVYTINKSEIKTFKDTGILEDIAKTFIHKILRREDDK